MLEKIEGLTVLRDGTTLIVNDNDGVDDSNGDLYWTTTATYTVNGMSVTDGGVVRLPGAKYTANPNGTVASAIRSMFMPR